MVLGLPRGGVPVAQAVAEALGAPLDLLVARKVGHRYNPEYAVAAVTEHGTLIRNEKEVEELPREWLAAAVAKEEREAKRRRDVYTGRPMWDIRGKVALLIDDGLATGLTMRAAIADARKLGAKHVVVAAPVAPVATAVQLLQEADDVVVLHLVGNWFGGVGGYYDDFPQLTDDTVIECLQNASEQAARYRPCNTAFSK